MAAKVAIEAWISSLAMLQNHYAPPQTAFNNYLQHRLVDSPPQDWGGFANVWVQKSFEDWDKRAKKYLAQIEKSQRADVANAQLTLIFQLVADATPGLAQTAPPFKTQFTAYLVQINPDYNTIADHTYRHACGNLAHCAELFAKRLLASKLSYTPPGIAALIQHTQQAAEFYSNHPQAAEYYPFKAAISQLEKQGHKALAPHIAALSSLREHVLHLPMSDAASYKTNQSIIEKLDILIAHLAPAR